MRLKTVKLSNMKKNIYATLVLVLTLAVLLASASYAWLTIAQAPEITGIDTTVGANGSLEIALLNGETYLEPGTIRTRVGASDAVAEAAVANISWGNVVDLGDESYGLKEVSMRPSRLNVNSGGIVPNNMLMFPTYSADGRLNSFAADTVTATRGEHGFVYQAEKGYGVRAIGTAANLSPQQMAMVEARAAVRSYASEARSIVQAMWKDYGPGVLNVYYQNSWGEDTFTSEEMAAVHGLAVQTRSVLDLVEEAYRYAAVGYLASTCPDERLFEIQRTAILSADVESLSGIGNFGLSSGFFDAKEATSFENWQEDNNEGYPADELLGLMNALWTDSGTYLGEKSLLTPNLELSGDDILTVRGGSADNKPLEVLADYLGNYSAFFTVQGKSVEVRTSSREEIGLLTAMSVALDNIQPATGPIPEMNLRDIYGFAIDLGFRSNAVTSDLLLQTESVVRMEDGRTNLYEQHQGGGSYIRFTSEQLDTERIALLMDAVRVGFVDRSGTLIAVAKPNSSNFEERNGEVSAPLYLYEFEIGPNGALLMAERQKENNVIQSLTQGQPAVLSAVVWLDGDHVDNRLAATSGQSVTGMLNLQFASSANLIASGDQMFGEE